MRTHPRPATSCWWGTSCPTPRTAADRTPTPRRCALREQLPAALVPLLARGRRPADADVGQGRPGRAALAAAASSSVDPARRACSRRPRRWLAESGRRSSASPVADPKADFFAIGGGSLAAAQLVARIRTRLPAGVGHRHLPAPDAAASCARRLEASAQATGPCAATSRRRRAAPRSRSALLMLPLFSAGRAALGGVAAAPRQSLPPVPGRIRGRRPSSWWWLAAGWLVLFSPAGRIAIAAGGARLLLRGVRPGQYPRGGRSICGCGPPSGSPSCQRRDLRLERVLAHPLRPRAGREDRQRRRPALAAAR